MIFLLADVYRQEQQEKNETLALHMKNTEFTGSSITVL